MCIRDRPDTAEALLADLWLPPDGVPNSGLAIIWLHGGAWYSGNKGEIGLGMIRHLVRQGHVVLDLAYTLAPLTDLQGQINDVKWAITWMRQNAASYNIDPAKIGLIGFSSGAHLALMTAYQPTTPGNGRSGDTSVAGVAAFFPPVDLADLLQYHGVTEEWRAQPDPDNPTLERLVRRLQRIPAEQPYYPPRRFLKHWLGELSDEEASPIHHIGPHCPPTLLMHGEYDQVVPPTGSRRLQAALNAAGVRSLLVEYPMVGHAFDVPAWSPAGQAALHDVERFFAILAGDPS
ncbi:MAG: alpha/beta hydrolase, partial [Chloroflexi bacterium]|nr:alpha/beta hydrolase [Chloroflexota bacterium]